ncbi:MAG: hypothetical protein RJA33_899 [Actinomycetota bacterium]|jgi:archaetidylinositol phosphate synthase
MKISRKEFNQRWSELHGNVEVQGAIAIWLAISYVIARVLSFFRITPNVMTLIGVLASVALLQVELVIVALFLVIFSLICDGVDGSLAIYQNRVSRLGGLYDAIADRISEAMWLILASYLDVPARYAIAIWVLGATQEYARARLASLGYQEIGVITPTERPMRAIFVVALLILYYFQFGFALELAYGFIALQIVSLLMVMKMARSILR